MLLDGVDFFVGEGGVVGPRSFGCARKRAETAIALVPPGATGDLGHFGRSEAALAHPVKL